MKKITLALLLLMMGNSISAQDSQETHSHCGEPDYFRKESKSFRNLLGILIFRLS